MLRESEQALCYLLIELFIAGTTEGELPAEHGVKENASSPDISWWAHILLLHDDFRAHVRRCPAKDLQLHVIGCTATEAEVYELDGTIFRVDDDVLKFDVAMCDVSLVQVRQRLKELL